MSISTGVLDNPLIGDLGSVLSSGSSSGRRSSNGSDGNFKRVSVEYSARVAVQSFKEILAQNGISRLGDLANSESNARRSLQSKNHSQLLELSLSLITTLDELSKSYEDYEVHHPVLAFGHGPSISSTVSMMSIIRPPVHETTEVRVGTDVKGHKMINRYVLLSELGHGAYGVVHLGEDRDTNRQVAIKIIPKGRLKTSLTSDGVALRREIAIMKKLRHRNCVSLLEVIDAPGSDQLYLVMEYFPNGSILRVGVHPQGYSPTIFKNSYLIEKVMREDKFIGCIPLSEDRCSCYLRQLVNGLRYLHKRGVIHHDIKPENILRDDGERVCFSDFGVSEIVKSERDASKRISCVARLGAATPLFTSPESFAVGESGDSPLDAFMSDIWALGITLYIMLVGVTPFNGLTYFAVSNDVQSSDFPWNGKNVSDEDLHSDWKAILDGMLKKKPSERWTLTQLRNFLETAFSTSPKIESSENELSDNMIEHLCVTAEDIKNATVQECAPSRNTSNTPSEGKEIVRSFVTNFRERLRDASAAYVEENTLPKALSAEMVQSPRVRVSGKSRERFLRRGNNSRPTKK